jgi:hypothetical protein
MSGLIPNGIITVEGHYAMLTFKRRLKHPIEAVWAAITDPEQRAAWFGITTIDARTGGTIETIAEGPPVPFHFSTAYPRFCRRLEASSSGGTNYLSGSSAPSRI